MALDKDVADLNSIIDLSGDVRFLLPENHTVLVSSRILAFHSKVFTAMFTGQFAESTLLSVNQDSSIPTEIKLLYDDAEAMTTLCKVLHGKLFSVPRPTARQLLNVVVLADKYDCMESIISSVAQWISLSGEYEEYAETALDRLAIAYIANLPREFYEASGDVIDTTSGFFHVSDLEACHEALPSKLFGKLVESWNRLNVFF